MPHVVFQLVVILNSFRTNAETLSMSLSKKKKKKKKALSMNVIEFLKI